MQGDDPAMKSDYESLVNSSSWQICEKVKNARSPPGSLMVHSPH